MQSDLNSLSLNCPDLEKGGLTLVTPSIQKAADEGARGSSLFGRTGSISALYNSTGVNGITSGIKPTRY